VLTEVAGEAPLSGLSLFEDMMSFIKNRARSRSTAPKAMFRYVICLLFRRFDLNKASPKNVSPEMLAYWKSPVYTIKGNG
jgi:hypothetical protein